MTNVLPAAAALNRREHRAPPELPASCPQGELRGVRTRFGASLDLTWTADGRASARLRPERTHRIELRTPSGAEPLDLAAGEDRVISVKAR